MRILHLFDHSIPLHSGYTFRSLQIISHQRALGWETFHVTSPKHGKFSESVEQIDGIQFFRSPPPSGLGKIPGLHSLSTIAGSYRRLKEVAGQIKPDLIHAHSPVLNALAALPVAAKLGIPLVYEVRAFWEDAAVANDGKSERSLRYLTTRMLETYALRRSDGVATICNGLREDIIARGIAPEKVAVVPNAVDATQFLPAGDPDPQLVQAHGLEGRKVVAFIGSFYPYEGLDDLILSLGQVRARLPDIKLLLVGGGPAQADLESQVDRLGLNEHVVFVGRVPHDQVPRYYELADVMVYPRKPIRLTETVTPLKPLEAMAQKKPLIASDVGGHRELIEDGKTGHLFTAGDVTALGDSIAAFFADPSGQHAMIEQAYRYVVAERTWARSIANYAPLFDRLTGADAVK